MFIALDEFDELICAEDTVPGKLYKCPACCRTLSVRRGSVRKPYFAHLQGETCSDTWNTSYDMSDWHRDWQNMFPIVNQEVVVQLGDIKHRADVLTGKTVIEFQHSPLTSDMFNKRNAFYQDLGYKVVWLFDLVEEVNDGKVIQREDGRSSYVWKHPRHTFDGYDLESGRTEVFFQLRENAENCIVKVEANVQGSFAEFTASKQYSKEQFLEYFQCINGTCPKPFREDIRQNEDYLRFKEKYGICLDPQQERAAETVDGAILVLAVPGSGKTTTLISRIGYMVNCKGIDASSILALTYTKNAAEDMKRRYESAFGKNEKVNFYTLNAFANGIIRKCGIVRTVAENDERNRILSKIFKMCYPNPGDYPTKSDLQMASTTISNIKNRMLCEDEIRELRIWNVSAKEVYDKYKTGLENIGKIDFDDQLVLAYQQLKENTQVLVSIQERYKYICVDEAQDTSKLQYEIIKLLSGKYHNIFMVGDEDQSIYRFRAACPEALLNFRDEYPNPFILKLETNYRSTSEIVDFASRFIAKNSRRYPKRMISARGEGIAPARIVVPNREEQYADIVSKAKKHHNGQMAILFRDNVCALPLADLLLKNGLPFSMRKTEEILFFHEHIVNDIKAFLSLSQDYHNTEAFKNIYYKCGAYIKGNDIKGICGKVYYQKMDIFQAIEAYLSWGNRDEGHKARWFRDRIEPMSKLRPAEAIRYIFDHGYGEYLREKKMGAGHIDILISLANDDETVDDFFAHLDRLEKQLCNLGNASSDIILSTVHSSKGLEYDKVLLMDVIDGLFPSVTEENIDADDIETLQEERRLFYVAMTRAKNELTVYRTCDHDSSFVDELFPTGGTSIDQVAMQLASDKFMVEDTLTNLVYIVETNKWWLRRANEIDLNTGELLADCTSFVEKNKDRPIWRAYGISASKSYAFRVDEVGKN